MLPLVTAVCLTTSPKRREMLPDAFRAFTSQTYAPLEMVVVNDGTPLVSRDPRVRVINVPPASVGRKRQIGLDAVQGKYFAPWDDDDLSFPDRITRLVERAERTNAAVARSGMMWIADAAMNVRGLVTGSCYATAVLRTDAARHVGGYNDLNYREDMWLLTKFGVHGFARVVDLEPVYVARRHALNVSATAGGDTGRLTMHGEVPVSPADLEAIQRYVQVLRSDPPPALVAPA